MNQGKQQSKIMQNALTTQEKWEAIWADIKLPIIARPGVDIQKILESLLPRNSERTFIEIGCAPGGWMAYFSKHFGYRVSGLEYVPAAGEITKRNMLLLAIDANVLTQDFFIYDLELAKYDVVFSAGFIEHFRDAAPVIERISMLTQRYVVTIVPNVFGVNGFISKKIRPRVYEEHTPIDVTMLNRLHTNAGLKTLFCDYVGGIQFIMPGAHNDFFNKHKLCAKTVNLPFRFFNLLSDRMQSFIYMPRTKLFSRSLLYIGIK